MLPAQISPSAGVLTDLYTVPVGVFAVISTLNICNCNPTDANVCVTIAINGEADNIKQYYMWDTFMPTGNPWAGTFGWKLNAGDVIRVKSTVGDTAFNLFGVEEPVE
jgi:hypothetical protein